MCAQVAASTNKVTNFVGKVVNGFDIQKLIGELILLPPSFLPYYLIIYRLGQIFICL